jgi:PAS domain S-box-containing protein
MTHSNQDSTIVGAASRNENRLTTMDDNASSYQYLIQGIAQIVWKTDAAGEITTKHPTWEGFTGQTYDRYQGWGWLDAIHPEDRDLTAKAWKTAIEKNTLYQFEHRVRHHSGNYYWMAVHGVPVFNPQQTIAEWIGLHIDITDRKTAELALQAQARELSRLNVLFTQMMALVDRRNQELDQFTHTIAHDLKSPLRAISNLSEWIEDDLSGKIPLDNEQQLQLLRSRVARMEALIDGLLEYARIGRLQLDAELVVVSDLIIDIIDSLAPPAGFKIEIAPDLPTIHTQRLLLGQVFSNLISNAIKHHDRLDGHIQITGAILSDRDRYEFAVTDDGPGIPPEQQELVFGMFQTLSHKAENTGIGLAIVRKIIENEGGQIMLSSLVGAGTTFRFTWSESG